MPRLDVADDSVWILAGYSAQALLLLSVLSAKLVMTVREGLYLRCGETTV